MINMLFENACKFMNLAFNKVVMGLSLVFGTILSAIGYPKQVLGFILILTIIDTATKHYSIVKINYNAFTLKNYLRAWKDRNLTSRGLKNGLGIKTILYLPVLFVAHQVSILPEIIWGKEISNILYSLIAIIEFRSILENFEDCGAKGLSSILKFIKGKEEALITASNEDVKNGTNNTEISVEGNNQGEDDQNDFGDRI